MHPAHGSEPTVHQHVERGYAVSLPAEEFFKGKTRAGRELHLFYEHTAFETYDTEDGPYDNPTETDSTATLDGVPIKVEGMTWSGGSVTVRTDEGTFSAVSDDSDEDHAEALRRHLEWRPSGGWGSRSRTTRRSGRARATP